MYRLTEVERAMDNAVVAIIITITSMNTASPLPTV